MKLLSMLTIALVTCSILIFVSDSKVEGFAFANKKKSVGANKLPKFDGKTEKWIPTGPNQLPEAGYPPLKTLLLQGPQPFFTRIFQPDDYEQAVLKFMASDKLVSRDQAQGNMDAYLRNPADWMFTRKENEKKGIEVDYTIISVKDVALVSVWGLSITYIVGRIIYSIATGTSFNG